MTLTVTDLKGLWDDMVKRSLIDVDTSSTLIFYSCLGAWFVETPVYAPNKTFKPRIHTFIIAGPRSGKGEILEIGERVCTGLGINSEYQPGSMTAKALTGGLTKVYDKGKLVSETPSPGALKNFDYIAWAEARSLLKNDEGYGSMKDVLLSAMDERGEVSTSSDSNKYQLTVGMIGKQYRFQTKSTICTGGTMTTRMTEEITNSGLLQRFLIDYNRKSTEQHKKFQEKLDDASIENLGIKEEKIKKLKETKQFPTHDDYINILTSERRNFINAVMKNTDRKNYDVQIEKRALQDFMAFKRPIIDKYFDKMPPEGTNVDSFNGFLTSYNNYIWKIATINCCIEKRKIVNYEDMLNAFSIVQKSLDCSLRLLNIVPVPGVTRAQAYRTNAVLEVIRKIISKKNVVPCQSEVVNILCNQEYHKGNWDLSPVSTRKFMAELVEKDILTEKKPGGNKILYMVTSDLEYKEKSEV